MSFHEVRFPSAISLGAMGGIARRTEIVALVNGQEERNTPWAHSRRRYDAGRGVRSLDDLDQLLRFFEARRGMLYGFRWKDWLDHQSCTPSSDPGPEDQTVGTGDGTTREFQLIKHYSDAAAGYARPITKPLAGSVRMAIDGSEIYEGQDFIVDVTRGRVELASAPAVGALLTAGFVFDVPVRFDTDVIEINLAGFQAGEIPSIPVVEVRS